MLSHEYDLSGTDSRSKVMDSALRRLDWSEDIDSSVKFKLLYPGDRIECIVVDEMSAALSSAIGEQLYAEQLIGNCVLDPIILHFEDKHEETARSKKSSKVKMLRAYRLAIDRLHRIRDEIERSGAEGVSRDQLQQFVD